MSDDLASPVLPWWRRIPIDLIALVAIAAAIVATHRSLLRHGIAFNDPSWFFHFGRRTLHGDVPYRDYVFQVGPAPIYLDALFQAIFGSKYIASAYAALFVKILRVWSVWSIGRRTAGGGAAALLAVFCAFDPILGSTYNWSWQYAQLFIVLSGLCFVLAAQATRERNVMVLLGLAGMAAALVVSARQATAVMLGLVLFATTVIMVVRKEFFSPRRFAALWVGFAAGLVVVFGALAAVGALGPAVQQMFLDAPQKKGVHGLTTLLDPISGGALVEGGFSWWGGALMFLGLPVALVAIAVFLSTRARDVSDGAAAALLVPVAVVFGLFMRDGSLDLLSDLPRIFLTTATLLAIAAPHRLRHWLGVEPIVAIGLAALPLASEWAVQLSLPGRGWSDVAAMLVGTTLVVLASSRVGRRAKLVLCAGMAVSALVHVDVSLRAHRHPFTVFQAADGLLTESQLSVRAPALRGLQVTASRKKAVDWLVSEVKPGSTCFLYGTLPILYDILGCKNPSHLDVTIPDFFSLQDANDAMAIVLAHPPDYLISCESSWMSPPLTLDLLGKTNTWSPMNSDAAKAIHVGLRSLLDQYESVGLVSDILGPELTKQATASWDGLQSVRLYRRKLPASP